MSDKVIIGLFVGLIGGFLAHWVYEELMNPYVPSMAGVCIIWVLFLGSGAAVGALVARWYWWY